MGTGKRPISTAARLGDKAVPLELEMLQVATGLAEQLELVTLEPGTVLAPGQEGEISLLATVLALERKISGRLIGRVADLVQEISVAGLARAARQVPAARVAVRARWRPSALLAPPAEIALVIVVSHPAPDSGRVATLLAAAGLTEAPLDPPAAAEVPAWAAVELVVAAVAEDAEEEEAGAEGKQIIR